MQRRFSIIVPLLLAGCGSQPAPSPPTVAGVSIAETAERRYALTVTDLDGIEMRIRIAWSEYDGMYRTDGYDGGLAGVLFGNPDVKFASAAELRAMGRSPEETVHRFDPEEPLDGRWTNLEDVTILHVYGGDMVLGRWEGERVTDILYIGPFASLLSDRLAQGESRCGALVSLCCREEDVTIDDDEHRLPRPIIQACYGAALACDDQTKRDETCPCLIRACFGIDIDLPWQLSTPAAGACVWAMHLCENDRARSSERALAQYMDLFGRSEHVLSAIETIIDRMAEPAPASTD